MSSSPELIRLASTITVIIIALALHYFYQKRFKRNMRDKNKVWGIVIIVVSIIAALFLLR